MREKHILFVLILLFVITAQAQKPSDFDELCRAFNEIDFTIPNVTYTFVDEGELYVSEVMYLPERTQSNTLDKVLIFADSTLYSLYEYPIRRYAYDIYNVYGCEIKMFVIKGETCVDVKNLILSNSNDLDGVVFIGNIEPAWYEAYDVINHNIFTSWPCDMYFMDLDAVWTDNNHNDVFDDYTGAFNPEIFVGRIYTNNVGNGGDELELFEKYMDKNHAFWIGHRQVNKKYALSYTNPSWNNWQNDLINGIHVLYGQNKCDTITSNTSVFCANDYLERLRNERYEFVQLASHSYSFAHVFDSLVPTMNAYDTLHVNIHNSTIYSNGVNALGINLFCCSACNWNINGYLGGNYVYSPKSSVLSLLGCTKVGSMWDMPSFYQPLHNGKTIGQAFVDWWLTNYYRYMTKINKICYFFGLTIIGDPLVNFFHCTNNTCQNQLTLASYNNSNSPLSYYLASESITVSPPTMNSFTIQNGDHCILNAPIVLIDGEFLCPRGSTLEILNEGCKDNCDDE